MQSSFFATLDIHSLGAVGPGGHRPGAQAGSLLESEPMGDRSYSQWLSEEGPFCSGLRCVSEHLEP